MTNEISMDSAGSVSLSNYLEDCSDESLIICGRIELFEI